MRKRIRKKVGWCCSVVPTLGMHPGVNGAVLCLVRVFLNFHLKSS